MIAVARRWWPTLVVAAVLILAALAYSRAPPRVEEPAPRLSAVIRALRQPDPSPAVPACAQKLRDRSDAESLVKALSEIERKVLAIHPNGGPDVPRELRHTLLHNGLTGLVRKNMLSRADERWFAPLYIGSSAPEGELKLPRDARLRCILVPGQGILLSDDATHHMATIGVVTDDTVELIDPWAEHSFLRKGFNTVGVAAEPLLVAGRAPRLKLKPAELEKVLRAILAPTDLVEALPDFYGFLRDSEEYRFWRASHYFEIGDSEQDLELILSDGPISPRGTVLMKLLFDATGNIPCWWKPTSPRSEPLPARCEGKLERARSFVNRVPWAVFWRFSELVEQWADPQDVLQFYEQVVRTQGDDFDLESRRAWFSLELGRYDVAREIERDLTEQWMRDVAASIDLPQREAVSYFFDHRAQHTATPGLDILARRWCTLNLLIAGRRAREETEPGSSGLAPRPLAEMLSTIINACTLHSSTEFLYEVQSVLSWANLPAEEVKALEDVRRAAEAGRLSEQFLDRLASDLYAHLARHRNVQHLGQSAALDGFSVLLCSLHADGFTVPGANATYVEGIDRFCKKKKPPYRAVARAAKYGIWRETFDTRDKRYQGFIRMDAVRDKIDAVHK